MAWIEILPAAGLLLAALLRVHSRPGIRRSAAVALSSAAFAAVLAADPVAGWIGSSWGDHRDLLWLLLITVSASATFAVARRLALPASLLPWPPAAVGFGVAVLQVVLFYVAGTHGPDDIAVLDLAVAESTVLWLVTLGWPALACSLLVPPIRAYGPGLRPRPVRVAVAVATCGLLMLAASAAGHLAWLFTRGAPLDAELPVFELLASAGLGCIALAFLFPRAAAAVAPLCRWATAWLAVRRLTPLAKALEEGVPEWAARRGRSDSSFRNPSLRLYREVIAVRDSSWTLLACVDDAVIPEAVAFARRRLASADDHAVAALAEACWLSHALRVRRSGDPLPAAALDLVILDRASDEDDGSLRDEVSFLLAVAREWRDGRRVRDFLAALDAQRALEVSE